VRAFDGNDVLFRSALLVSALPVVHETDLDRLVDVRSLHASLLLEEAEELGGAECAVSLLFHPLLQF
jgi:hypothetical protein